MPHTGYMKKVSKKFSPWQGTATRECSECFAQRGEKHAHWCKQSE